MNSISIDSVIQNFTIQQKYKANTRGKTYLIPKKTREDMLYQINKA